MKEALAYHSRCFRSVYGVRSPRDTPEVPRNARQLSVATSRQCSTDQKHSGYIKQLNIAVRSIRWKCSSVKAELLKIMMR